MYINGNDLLVSIDGKAVGHCTTHTATFNTETKDTAVKPVATKSKEEAGKFKSKTVSGLSIQVKADGLVFHAETGCSPIKVARELGSERRETVRSLSIVGV